MTNNRYRPYWELCEDIEIWTCRYESYQAQYKAIKKMARLEGPRDIQGIDYTQPKVTSSGNQMGILEGLDRLRELESHLYLHSEAIGKMEEQKERMEKQLKDLVGLEYRVIYMRDIEGKSLKKISEELNYNYQYIREIASRNLQRTYNFKK